MKKNKEWLKKKVIDFGNLPGTYMSKTIVADVDMVNCLIDELEEPEQEKVVVPQFVADWIEDNKADNMNLGDALNTHYEDDREIHHWLYMEGSGNNDETFARAWIDGYTVEKEKRYYVYDKATKSYLGYNAVRTQLHWWTSRLENESFTEQEIKNIDERYWVFAEEITT